MTELKNELLAAPIAEWQRVPITENKHKWLLLWYRIGEWNFGFVFVSPKGRKYIFFVERGENGSENSGRVTNAVIVVASGKKNVANYYESLGDKPERKDAVLRLTPKHIIDRLSVLLDAIG